MLYISMLGVEARSRHARSDTVLTHACPTWKDTGRRRVRSDHYTCNHGSTACLSEEGFRFIGESDMLSKTNAVT